MPLYTSHPNQRPTFYSQGTTKAGRLEKIAVVVSVAAIAAFIVVDDIRTAPADAATTRVASDAAPDAQRAKASSGAGGPSAAAVSARAASPDAIR